MDSTLQLKERTALFAKESGYKKVSDNLIKLILNNCHVKMIDFVKKRYNQELVNKNYFRLSKTDYPEDSSIAGGYTISGWARIHGEAYFFNRTKYYPKENLGPLLHEQNFEILKRFGHEAGHVFTPIRVIKKMEEDKNKGINFNHFERFADDFSREFCIWVYDQEIKNLSDYEEGSLILATNGDV